MVPEAPRGSQRHPEAPRGSKRVPEAARGWYMGLQPSETIRLSSPRPPEAPRGSHPEAPRGCQRLPGDARGWCMGLQLFATIGASTTSWLEFQQVAPPTPSLPAVPRGSQRLPEAPRGSQRLAHWFTAVGNHMLTQKPIARVSTNDYMILVY